VAKRPASSAREKDEEYAVVAVLNAKLRVIAGSCDLQWIVQSRVTPRLWKSFAFCGTKEGLLLRLPPGGQGCEPKAWAVIEALLPYFRLSSLVTETM
jgi:hypothetical protein